MKESILMKRSELRQLLASYNIGRPTMEALIKTGRIERRYLPCVTRRKKNPRYAYYCRSQVMREVIDPMLKEG